MKRRRLRRASCMAASNRRQRSCRLTRPAEVFISETPASRWRELATHAPDGTLLGRSRSQWREMTRRELRLPCDRPILGTGHQPTLWHPGILAKYIAMDSVANSCGCARVNVVVNHDTIDLARFEAPVRNDDDSLGAFLIALAPGLSSDMPPFAQLAFDPAPPPADVPYAVESVAAGVMRIIQTIADHRDAPNAAMQMMSALTELGGRWIAPMSHVQASALGATSLAKAMMQRMLADPAACAEAYNRAVEAVPEAGIPPLHAGSDAVELPVWRIDENRQRVRAFDADVAKWLDSQSSTTERSTEPVIVPRALFMTAIVRLGVCDVFIHGRGGAVYDRAMELWVGSWLGAAPSPSVVVSADLRLPLDGRDVEDLETARHKARWLWHDPEPKAHQADTHPGPEKHAMLSRVQSLPRNSVARKAAFFEMHERLEAMRASQQRDIRAAFDRIRIAEQDAAKAVIAQRRDWPFPLYADEDIDALAEMVRSRLAVKRT